MADQKSYLKQVDSGVVLSDAEAVEDTEGAIKSIEVQKQLEVENQDLQRKLFRLVNDNLRLLKPEFKYQELDEFWELQKQLHANDFKKREVEFDARLKQLDKIKVAREERLKELTGDKK
jgi:hypothetical protein